MDVLQYGRKFLLHLDMRAMPATLTFFPFPRKVDVVSHPDIAWKTGSATDFSGPKLVLIEFM